MHQFITRCNRSFFIPIPIYTHTKTQVVQCSQNPSDPNRQAAHQLMMEMQQDAEMWCVNN